MSGRRAATRRLGAFQEAPLGGNWVVLQDLTFEHPHLHTYRAVSSVARGVAVIDIGAQRMERHAALAVPFHARDLRAAEPAAAIDTDALRTQPHRRLHRTLHGAAECDSSLELLRDRLRDEGGVN